MAHTSAERFEEMQNLHREYVSLIENFLGEQMKKRKPDSEIVKMISDFAVGRIIRKPGIRGYIFSKMSALVGVNDSKKIAYLSAAIELGLSSVYCFNVGADNKAGYGGSKKTIAFKTAEYLKDIHREFIFSSAYFSPIERKKIWDIFALVYEGFYIGQTFDVLINTRENLGKSVIASLKSSRLSNDATAEFIFRQVDYDKIFLKNGESVFSEDSLDKFLWQRIFGINAHMIEMFPFLIAAFHGGVPDLSLDSLALYGRYYGMGMMIINDVQDFSLDLAGDVRATREKERSDVFADIKNGRVTWPIMIALKKKDNDLRKNLETFYTHPYDADIQESMRKDMVESGIVGEVVLDGIAYGRLANKSLEVFAKSHDREMLEDTAISVTLLSKYVRFLSEKYGVRIRPGRIEINERVRETAEFLSENDGLLLRPYRTVLPRVDF